LGEYHASGLAYAQGEQAKASLQESLEIVLADGYKPPSPLREAAANRSLDQLAPDNPLAAEMGQMREALEDIRRTARSSGDTALIVDLLEDIHSRVPFSAPTERVQQRFIEVLRRIVERNLNHLTSEDLNILRSAAITNEQEDWASYLMGK